ncbi:MBL fold metallo-hydrolase [Kovacikia minuta CCNUW1]|uniref:MBL fold metallo-hydrolase n=1 Tax=Kovacikia minuta TaxID=2931930 RepID=UPI001CCB7F1F|nr:MBL fold metallo-hydrolase [Kovacikia minuta]UBF24672.1 MBL fold metallo-hydrolase [Kovacikia minuta CCNUW1]
MKLTRIDLNSWIFRIGGHTILVDPWLVDPLAFYGLPWLYLAYHNTPLVFTPETLPPIDLILLSQGVDDHCHKPTLERLDHSIPVVASPSAAKVVRNLGFHKVVSLSHWQDVEVTDTLQITAVLGAELQPGQVENGYLLRDLTTGETLYYEPHQAPFQESLKQRLGQVDVAIAPVIGQRFPLLGQVIMGPEQALQLVEILDAALFFANDNGRYSDHGHFAIVHPIDWQCRGISRSADCCEFTDKIPGSCSR